MSNETLERILVERRDAIAARFVRETEQGGGSSAPVPRPFLLDHIPTFLEEMTAALRQRPTAREGNAPVAGALPTARRHGEQRWELGFDPEALVREYGVLLRAILSTARECGGVVEVEDFELLSRYIGAGISDAVGAYMRRRDEELRDRREELEFLAQAGQLLASSLDYRTTLARVTRLLVPRLADWCVIHLDGSDAAEIPVAHVDPEKSAVLRELCRRYSLPEDPAFGYAEVQRTGRSRLAEDLTPGFFEGVARSEEHLELLQQMDSRGWVTVPLQVQGSVFGAIILAYGESRQGYAPSDLVLVEDVARRAAVAIDNARLYELSQQARSRVEAATRAKDEFVALISHELRTPLTSILGWLHLQRTAPLPESKREHAFEVIERNANALNHLVSDLLDISRVITANIRLNLSQVDLASIVEMSLEGARPAIEAKRLQLHVELEEKNLVVRADGDRMQQVVWNLVSNAVKFTPKGGNVRISLRRTESDAELVVRDDGMGIPPEFLPHVFESFRQSDSTATRRYGGLGIGLSIVKHLVDLHGGAIEARSEGPGKGASFVVRLPISPVVSRAVRMNRVIDAEATWDGLPLGLDGTRVLVVDDEEDARNLLVYLFNTCGMDVRTAEDAAAAVQELEAFGADVIVSDIGMPDEDGYSLIRRIRTLPSEEKARTPAIALTAYARSEDRSRALVEGFNAHLSKPVDPAKLLATIADLLGRSPLSR